MAGRGTPIGPRKGKVDAHILVIEAPYYEDVSKALAEGALAVLAAHGCTYERVVVPGALEIPQVLTQAALFGRFDDESEQQPAFSGAIALGCVIRGETSHYDIVCNNTNHWLMQIATDLALPVGNAVLTVDTHAQAMARAEGGLAGKGADAARACLRLIEAGRDFVAAPARKKR
jgi:6,7-dimethyl-8-ribityllumazine synthase